jgi:heterodisulfide reductase subunit B
MVGETDIKEVVWSEYQKYIPDNHFFYVRSCIRQTFNPGAEAALLKILKDKLSLDVFEDSRHTCCTGIGYHSDVIPLETIMTVIARQLSLMQESGYRNLLVSCVTSFGLYNEIIHTWQHFPDMLEQTRENLMKATGRTFELPDSVIHASDLIYRYRRELVPMLKYRLVGKKDGSPLRFVDHVGCHYAKIFPVKGVGGAEFPRVLSDLGSEWGARWIDYPERRHCCGFGFRHYLLKENRGYSVTHSRIKLESMSPFNPDFILTNCPGCNMFLDRWQYTLAEMEGVSYDTAGRGIPVLSFEELAALLLGFDPWEIGLQMHQVQVDQLMDKIGIAYDADKKYLGMNGRYIGKPDKPEVLIV